MSTSAHPLARPPGLDEQDPLYRCLEALLAATDAAEDLGLPTEAARDAHADALRRVGFPGDAYVLALVGGTGVGKSSLLNALAGTSVSRASVRRPTTSHPIAWIPATADIAAVSPVSRARSFASALNCSGTGSA